MSFYPVTRSGRYRFPGHNRSIISGQASGRMPRLIRFTEASLAPSSSLTVRPRTLRFSCELSWTMKRMLTGFDDKNSFAVEIGCSEQPRPAPGFLP